jgi:hypothetical protein
MNWLYTGTSRPHFDFFRLDRANSMHLHVLYSRWESACIQPRHPPPSPRATTSSSSKVPYAWNRWRRWAYSRALFAIPRHCTWPTHQRSRAPSRAVVGCGSGSLPSHTCSPRWSRMGHPCSLYIEFRCTMHGTTATARAVTQLAPPHQIARTFSSISVRDNG